MASSNMKATGLSTKGCFNDKYRSIVCQKFDLCTCYLVIWYKSPSEDYDDCHNFSSAIPGPSPHFA